MVLKPKNVEIIRTDLSDSHDENLSRKHRIGNGLIYQIVAPLTVLCQFNQGGLTQNCNLLIRAKKGVEEKAGEVGTQTSRCVFIFSKDISFLSHLGGLKMEKDIIHYT